MAVVKIEDYSLVHFLTLDPEKEDSISVVVQHMDHVLQYGEDEEVNTGHDDVDGEGFNDDDGDDDDDDE